MASAEAIYGEVPTPLYDELKSQHVWHDNNGNRERYREYVKRLQEKYPGCRISYPMNASTTGIGRGSEQPWNAAAGQNHYASFYESEKRCQLTNSYPNITRYSSMPGFNSLKQILKNKAKKEQNNANMTRRIQEAKNKEERVRLSKIPTGNLLGLNKKNEPNMIKFEPTKNGLNNRSKELNGLFRKSRKNRKTNTRKTRK